MSDIIAEIEKAIEKIKGDICYRIAPENTFSNDCAKHGFDDGVAIILPLLKKCIEQRNESIQELVNKKMISKKSAKEIAEITMDIGNSEILNELLGENHE